ncbi:MAG: hypothetical protein ACNI25_15195 [Halarcobacter sp.]
MQNSKINNLALILFIASELCYYLLIAQTGIIEHFSSNIYVIAPLPIGGVIGSLLTYFLKIKSRNKIFIFLVFQFLMSLFYPNFNSLMLFILGLSVGGLAPLLINELKKASAIHMGFALAISYTVGTTLFNTDPSGRLYLALILTTITLITLFFLPNKKVILKNNLFEYGLFSMVLWIFLDSALFETLSRDTNLSIWRDGYSFNIALFHIIGVFSALRWQMQKNQKELFIIMLFALSYLFYFLQEAFILSLVYPFVISYYNVVILQTLIKKDLKTISIYMIFIGWLASGAGLFTALESLTLFVPGIFLICLFKVINTQQQFNKELHYA